MPDAVRNRWGDWWQVEVQLAAQKGELSKYDEVMLMQVVSRGIPICPSLCGSGLGFKLLAVDVGPDAAGDDQPLLLMAHPDGEMFCPACMSRSLVAAGRAGLLLGKGRIVEKPKNGKGSLIVRPSLEQVGQVARGRGLRKNNPKGRRH